MYPLPHKTNIAPVIDFNHVPETKIEITVKEREAQMFIPTGMKGVGKTMFHHITPREWLNLSSAQQAAVAAIITTEGTWKIID